MTQHINPLLFEGEHLVRSVQVADDLQFVGLDVCRVLDLAKPHQALDRLDPDERGTCTVGTPGGVQSMITVTEPGAYRLIFASRKPVAERLKRWLAHDVIPSIRKTGSYGKPHQEILPAAPEQRPFPDWTMEELRTKGSTVNMYRLNWGPMSAQWIAPQLGFPTPPIEMVEHGRQFTMALVASPEAG